jgi:hypothetical protein
MKYIPKKYQSTPQAPNIDGFGTGKYNDPTSLPLNVLEYIRLKNSDYLTYTSPVERKPTPTLDDYNNEFFIRYFVKQRNNNKIIEIDKTQYTYIGVVGQIDGDLYLSYQLDWKIAGPMYDQYKGNIIVEHGIVDSNKRTLNIAEKTINGITSKLSNLVEYAILK